MRYVVVAVFVTACCAHSLGQDFNNYKTLLPQGPVPKDFTEQTAAKVATEVTTVTGKNARQKKMKKKFVLESTFGIDDFLGSGSVLFNDEVSLYLDAVLQEVLKPYPDLRKKIRVYTVKSASVNAFTTNNGLIFVNLGLLARLENEAQLAYVLAHEVVHYQKKHVINSYVTNIDIEESRGDYSKLSAGERTFAKSTYSKELESEADLDGTEIFKKSSYSTDSIERVFDVLKLADFPLYWSEFSKTKFESADYIFPDSLNLDIVKAIVVDENYDDSKSTHPNIKKRREAVHNKIGGSRFSEQYKVSQSRFKLTKKIARYELCRELLLEHRFDESLALAMSLQNENPDSPYLKETVAKAYYGMARLHFEDKLEFSEEQWSGEIGRIAHFIKKQSPYELGVLALRQLYFCQEESPGNAEISLMVKDLIRAFSEKHEGLKANFLRSPASKRIENLRHPYTQYAFIDFKDSNKFFDIVDKNVVPLKKDEPKEGKKSKKKVKSAPLKINKVVVVNPFYKKVDIRKRQKQRHIEAEQVLVNINDKINDAAIKLSLKADIINTNTVTSGQVSQMQSNTILNDWIDERMGSSDNMVSPIYNEMVALADKHKTDHFMWMGGITIKSKKFLNFPLLISAVAIPATSPWAAAHLFTAQGRTLYFALVFNARTQKLELVDWRQMGMKDNPSMLQSNIYYTLFKLKK